VNSILLFDSDFVSDDTVRLTDRRFAHVASVHRAEPGDTLQVGRLNGKLGTGTVTAIDGDSLQMTVALNRDPPPPLPCTLVISLPLPKSLRKVLHVATTMGVKSIHLLNSKRVEKSYWSSPRLQPERIREVLTLGLEQAVDTVLPQVHFYRRIRWFVEDDLPGIAADRRGLIAHPSAPQSCPRAIGDASVLVIGPEGGLVDYEVGYFASAGFAPVSIGPRILRVEEAVPALLGRLY
jgi:16S rRNA (uracil1498-N3)-methyltransferase